MLDEDLVCCELGNSEEDTELQRRWWAAELGQVPVSPKLILVSICVGRLDIELYGMKIMSV